MFLLLCVYLQQQRALQDTVKLYKEKIDNQSQETILNEVYAFAEQYKTDPMIISACLMIVAKDIYLNMFGPKETSDLLHLFADSKKDVIH